MAIMQHDDWDPNTLHSPNSHLVPPKKLLSDQIPLAEGKELIVDVPINPRGITDVFIDDTTGLTIDLVDSDHALRLERAILLAIHVIARPKHPDEPIP